MLYSATKNEIFKVDEDINLPSYVWIPEGEVKAIFIAIHGGMGHGGDWETTALFFKEKGIKTYAMDLRHHGLFNKHNSSKKIYFHISSYDIYVNDLDKYYQSIKKDNPDTPIFFLSHSNGSLISLYYRLTKGENADIRGFIVSSPWLVNRVKISPIIKMISKLLAIIKPTMAITPEPLTDVLTHDLEITARHHRDEESGIRGTQVSAKLSVEYLKAQKYVMENIKNWKNGPILGIISGDDHLADPQRSINALNSISSVPVKILYYPDNFHENFNELNRKEIFDEVWNWLSYLI